MNLNLQQIKLLAMDFDGIHTDGYVYVREDGTETVRCSRRDGLGLEFLKKAGILLCVISKEKNQIVRTRCNKLGIECVTGVEDGAGKLDILKSIMERENIASHEVAYIGDDINDIEPLMFAGVGVTVADGHEEVKKIADLVLSRRGGEHALRELCDLILSAKSLGKQETI